MRINMEAYLLLNGWMDYLSLLWGAYLKDIRFPMGRAALASALGGGWAAAALMRLLPLQGPFAALLGFFLLCLITYGPRGACCYPAVMAGALFLSGFVDALLQLGFPPWACLWAAGGCALLMCVLRRTRGQGKGDMRLRIMLYGKAISLPALRDSGNLLRDGVTGLPVIVVSQKALGPLMPPHVQADDPSTLPKGWRLISVHTAAGEALLMCFRPDLLELTMDKRAQRTEAILAVSCFGERRALIPEGLRCFPWGRKADAWKNKEDAIHAGE